MLFKVYSILQNKAIADFKKRAEISNSGRMPVLASHRISVMGKNKGDCS
jgi:hypothetical protein